MSSGRISICNLHTFLVSFMNLLLLFNCIRQSLMGLSHIHQKRIIHRDIKALNMFLDASENIKVRRLLAIAYQ